MKSVFPFLLSMSASNNQQQDIPFGAWKSPITSKSITAGSVKIGGIYVCQTDLYWLEGRPQEAGRNVLCRYNPEDESSIEVTPKDSNVRTRVHEYGGGALTFGYKTGEIIYSDFQSQRLYKLGPNKQVPETLTPDGDRFRFADGVYDQQDTQQVFCVREDHQPLPK